MAHSNWLNVNSPRSLVYSAEALRRPGRVELPSRWCDEPNGEEKLRSGHT